MTKKDVLERITALGVVAVVRANGAEELVNVTMALQRGGLDIIELTMTTPNAVEAIQEVSRRFKEQVVLGAGTVLDPETARMVILAGAEFVVSPVVNPDVITMCKRYNKVAIPGAFTPTEILRAWEMGADVVKVFPATKLGPEFFRDMKGPFPQIALTPTGGVSLDNIDAFIKAGAMFVGVGGNLVDKRAIAQGNWDAITEVARQFVDAVRKARE